jgi:hypothetical protein
MGALMKGKIQIDKRYLLPLVASMFFFILYGVLMVIVAFKQGDYLSGAVLSFATLWWSHIFTGLVANIKEQTK